MKVSVDQNEGFKPFTLSITIETADEAKAIYAIMNHQQITDTFPCIDHAAIRMCIRSSVNISNVDLNEAWARLNGNLRS